MKKAFILLLVLFGASWLYSQDCDKYVITTKCDNFDSITANYKQILLKDVERGATSLPSFFENLAVCWLDRVKGFEAFQDYSIKQKFLDDYPETIFLVFNSRSLETKEEKQKWFNLMPMMNEEQMYKLYNILEREMLKINEIEIEYAEKKKELLYKYRIDNSNEMVSNASDTTLAYLGYVITVDEESNKAHYEVDYWKRKGRWYVNEEGKKKEDISFLYPYNLTYISNKVDNNKRFVINYYENVIYSYLMNLKQGKGIMPSDEKSQEYVTEWWEHLMRKYHDDKNKAKEFYNLATLAMEEHVIDEQEKSSTQSFRHFYLFDLSMETGEYGKASEYFSVYINNKTEKDWSPQRFVRSLYVPILCDEEKIWESSRLSLENAFINWYNNVPETAVYEKIKNVNVQTSIMVSDYYLHFGNNEELKQIVRPINSKLKDLCTKGELRYGEDIENEWYEFLNKSYLNGTFNGVYDYEGLEAKVKEGGFAPTDAPMVEYVCYYCLYQMIHSFPKKDDYVSQLLRQVQRICNNPSSKAHGYIEQYIAKDLEFRLQQGDSRKEPQVYLVSPNTKTNDYSTTDRIIELSFVVGDRWSEALYDAQVVADGMYKNDRFDKSQKSVWKFKEKIALEPGENKILIEYTDVTRKSYCDTLRITYTPKDYTVRKDIALLFAVDKYDDKVAYKSFTENGKRPIQDAESFSKLLEEYGFETHIYRNPKVIEIDQALGQFAKADYGEYDQLLIFFSGHGTIDDFTGNGYFVPADGCSNNKQRTMISYNYIKDLFKKRENGCHHVLVVADACFSGTFIKQVKGEENDNKKRIQEEAMGYESRCFIGSARKDEESPAESEIMKAFKKVFNDPQKDIIDFSDLEVAIRDEEGIVKEKGRWGDDDRGLGSFYFNKRK